MFMFRFILNLRQNGSNKGWEKDKFTFLETLYLHSLVTYKNMHLNKQFVLPEWFLLIYPGFLVTGANPLRSEKPPLIREISTSAYDVFAIEYWTIISLFFCDSTFDCKWKLKTFGNVTRLMWAFPGIPLLR